jgi:hypothetical protein
MSRPPSRPSIGRQGILAVHLRQCQLVNHKLQSTIT